MPKKKYANFLYIVFLGGISAFSLPPYNYFIINFFSFSLFFIFIFNQKKKFIHANYFFKYGWYFGFGYFLCSLYWVPIALNFDPTFKLLVPIATILLPAFMAIFYGLAIFLFSIFHLKNVVSSFLFFSILLGSVEFIRGLILTGFPWNLIAFSFSESNYFIQILSIIGTYSFNLICISIFAAPALFFLKKSKKEIIACFFFISVFFRFFIFGYIKSNEFNSFENVKNSYIIRAISSDISIDRFYSNKDELKIVNELIELSAPEKKMPIIFLWPEGIIPESYLKDIGTYKNLFLDNFGNDDIIIMGLNSRQNKNGKNLFFNSMAVFNNELDLIKSYNKVNLVPFGEFIPFEKVLSLVGFKTITNEYQSFSRGDVRIPLTINNNKIYLRFLPLICYEIIYSGKLSKDKNFDYIFNISEDGWFGKSVGPKQHFAHSVFRAIESGKYIIRSANNGISAIINPIGIVEKKIKLGSTGYIDFSESRPIKSTTFLLFGNKIFLILILLYIFLIFSFNRLTNE